MRTGLRCAIWPRSWTSSPGIPPGPGNQQLVGPAASRAATTTGMADHDWIHLACHAGPLDSHDGTVNRGFVLWDGELTMTDLAAQPERRGGLAFLSACQTASGSAEHPDEALHLAAAMQFIGYSHVVATMWSIKMARPARRRGILHGPLRGRPRQRQRTAGGNHAASGGNGFHESVHLGTVRSLRILRTTGHTQLHRVIVDRGRCGEKTMSMAPPPATCGPRSLP